MHIKRRALGQRGDTLVEVLVAIGIVSLVLGGAYITTNKALQATRDAQERTAGLKLVEGQFEQLRSVAATNTTSLFGATATAPPYCMVNGATATGSACTMDASGASPGTGQPKYTIKIDHHSGDPDTFELSETWPAIGGGTESIAMQYRLHQAL